MPPAPVTAPVILWTVAIGLAGAFGFATAIYWGIALGRIILTRRRIPTADTGAILAQASPSGELVHVVIPAHNEEAHIEDLIASLRGQRHDRFRVTLALDRCTDKTAQRARSAIGADPRFAIVEIDACPDGWAGKVHAVWCAMNQPGRNDDHPGFLLFIDADTRLAPDCLGATLALARERELDLLSLLSTLTADRWFERIVQPSAAMELVYQFPLLRCNGRAVTRPFANGQFMLFRNDAYERVGGHEAVKDELLEDLALARLISERGMNAGVFLAGDQLHCRMYESWSEFKRGWKRIYTESARRRQERLRRRARRKRLTGSIMPAGSLAAVILGAARFTFPSGVQSGLQSVQSVWIDADAVWAIAGGSLGLFAYSAVAGVVLIGLRVPVVHVVTFPIGAWLVGGILQRAAKDLRTGAPTNWGGRSYTRQSR